MASKIFSIAGASRCFGNITAKLLAENGHTVYANMPDTNGKNKAHKEALLAWAKAEQVDLKVVELAVTSDQSVENAKNEILAKTNGIIDVIFNNAGIYGVGIQEAFKVNDHKALFEVNVFETVRVNNAFLPVLRKQGRGLIIQTSSILGRIVIPFGGVYDATKWVVEALSETLTYELKPLGIDVAIVQPGVFPTELFQKVYNPGNPDVVADYGKSAELLNTSSQTTTAMMADPNIPNKSEQVAEAIVKLVNTPQGQVPLRTVVDKMMGGITEMINEAAQKVQNGILQNFGFGELVKN